MIYNSKASQKHIDYQQQFRFTTIEVIILGYFLIQSYVAVMSILTVNYLYQ